MWRLVILLAACGGARGGGTTCIDPASGAGVAMVLDRAEIENGMVADGDDRGVGARVGEAWAVHAAIDDPIGGAIAVVARRACSGPTCAPKVVRILDDKLAYEAALPATADIATGYDYPYLTEWLALEDVDGDGAPEVWVGYNVVGEPEPAVGSTTRRHVAAFTPGNLRRLFHAEISTSPEADTLERCEAEIRIVDADCDGMRDLVVARTCGARVERTVFVRDDEGLFVERR